MTIRFLHLTDLHLRDPEDEAALGAEAPSVRLRGVLDRAARLDPAPAFIAITGDLADDGAPGAYRLLAEILQGTNLPVFMAMGNHDDRAAFRAAFGETGEGPVCRDAAVAGLHVIVLDTLVPGRTGGALSDAALAALDGALTRHSDLPRLVLLHHPPRAPWDTDNAWDALTGASTEALAARLAGHSVAGLLAGHVHYDGLRMWQGAPLVLNTGLSATIDPTDTETLHVFPGASYGFCRWTPESGLAVSFVPVAPARDEIATVSPDILQGGG